MFPTGWRFSYMSWWAVPTSSKANVRRRQGSTFPAATISLNAADCSSLAKCDPWRRLLRIQR